MTRTAAQIRQEFIDFFCQRHGHTFVPSSPVVPHDDPTLLFTNAGMNQFKPIFLAQVDPNTSFGRLRRVANTQKCIRAGGKHNDLDDVGHDTYHHTFFEMLGNWSFGDYFKREAIKWAWELLTKVWGLDKRRLHATYFGGDPAEHLQPDLEARDLWAHVTDIDPSHIHPGNKKDNFWEMGETGPCGPCSEIHIDLTPDVSGGGLVNAGDARVMEIWNLVFIQFNRGPDGKLTPLPAKHVDTGMGFERVTAVIQGMESGRLGQVSNYDTDVFTPIFAAIQNVTGAPAYGGRLEQSPSGSEGHIPSPSASAGPGASTLPQPLPEREGSQAALMRDIAYRVIADHIRTLTFAITDGAVPDKEGRGFVLRRILRRAVRYAWQYLDAHEPFLYRIVPTVIETMAPAFPELRSRPGDVVVVLREEEESFGRTLERGIALFEDAADVARRQHAGVIQGADAFRLHDTYGFPIDLTEVMAAEKGMRVDIGEYERLMEEARNRARAGTQADTASFAMALHEARDRIHATDDSPKYTSENVRARVTTIIRQTGGASVLLGDDEPLKAGERGAVICDRTCFYAEAGGQVGDQGTITAGNARFEVEDTLRPGHYVLHVGTLAAGTLRAGHEVELRVDRRRTATMKNHTATHLLNWALREVLGDHIQQKGSLVDHEKTRFDFSHPKPLTPEEIERVEQLVNEKIRQNVPVHWQEVPQEQALRINGLRAVFGERYPDVVRVLSVGVPVDDLVQRPDDPRWREVSVEFCGGTHVKSTGQIESFVIAAEEAVAKGIRRIIGLSGETAERVRQAGDALVRRAEQLLQSSPAEAHAGLTELQSELAAQTIPMAQRATLRGLLEQLQKRAKEEQKASAADAASVVLARVSALLEGVQKVGATAIVVSEMPSVPLDALKIGADAVKQKAGSAAVLFGSAADGKVTLLAAMSNDLVQRGVKAGDLVKAVAPIVGGGGGGPPTMAQAGGKQPDKLGEALEAGRKWITAKLS